MAVDSERDFAVVEAADSQAEGKLVAEAEVGAEEERGEKWAGADCTGNSRCVQC